MNLFECQKDLSGNNQLTLFASPVPNFKYMIVDKTSQIRLLTLHFSYSWLAVTNTSLTIFSLALPTPLTKYSSKYSLSTIFTCSWGIGHHHLSQKPLHLQHLHPLLKKKPHQSQRTQLLRALNLLHMMLKPWKSFVRNLMSHHLPLRNVVESPNHHPLGSDVKWNCIKLC